MDELGCDLPDWVPGELWIGGYSAAPKLTIDCCQLQWRIPSSLVVHRTGDRGRYRPDGILEFLGRRDGQIKLHGHRIELSEIE